MNKTRKEQTQRVLKQLAVQIDWKKREKDETWESWYMSLTKFVDELDKWQIAFLFPEKTLGKHKIQGGEIVGKVPVEEQMADIRSTTRKQYLDLMDMNIWNCCRGSYNNEYPSELRKKINKLAGNKDYHTYFLHTQGQEVI